MNKRYILFDFDGTVLNTNEIIIDSWQAVFLRYAGEKGDEAAIYATFGEPIRDTMRKFFPDVPQDEAIDYYRAYQNEHYNGRVSLFPGILDLFRKLRALGLSLSIVTSRTKQTTEEYVDLFGIRSYFDVILTCDDVGAHKPDPAPILRTLELLGASPEEAIMLGDSKYDIGCANNAGVDSVLVSWGHEADLREMAALGFRPTHQIDAPAKLLPLL